MENYTNIFDLTGRTAMVIGANEDGIGHALFLASRALDFFAGHTLFVDGGVTAW